MRSVTQANPNTVREGTTQGHGDRGQGSLLAVLEAGYYTKQGKTLRDCPARNSQCPLQVLLSTKPAFRVVGALTEKKKKY